MAKNLVIVESPAKKKIIQQCLEIKDIGKNIKNALAQFHYTGSKKWYPKWDVVNLFEDAQILPILYETNFLQKNDLSVIVNPEFEEESNKIRQISIDFSNAGYDIESFNGKTRDCVPDRFIEVKGTTKKEFSFYWSINEINTAKELSSNYWIYYVSEIDVQNKTSSNDPKMINNPYENIFSNDLFQKNIESYHIQEQDDNNSK